MTPRQSTAGSRVRGRRQCTAEPVVFWPSNFLFWRGKYPSILGLGHLTPRWTRLLLGNAHSTSHASKLTVHDGARMEIPFTDGFILE